ncbi:hypothetical protein ACET3Z_022870 [Daucus carota]
MENHQRIIKQEEDMEEGHEFSGNDKKKIRSGNNGARKIGNTGSNVSGGGSGSPPMRCCQAERCSADLNDAKQYHKRHKVCEYHAKAQVVVVAGVGQRFCQQCSRFHELSEFDETKRSCRRRLAGHNERRRKSSSDSQGEGGGSSSRKGSTAAGGKDLCGKVQISSMQENATTFKHFQIR